MSAKVKQANFRLPLAYMDLIDEVSKRENITKAAVITKALDCLKASYDSGGGGIPAASASGADYSQELEELRANLASVQDRSVQAERAQAEAEERARKAEHSLAVAEDRARRAEQLQADAEDRARNNERSRGNDESRIIAAEQARDAAQNLLANAEQARKDAESKAREAEANAREAESKARDAEARLAAAEAKLAVSATPSADSIAAAAAAEEELMRLRTLAKKRETTLEEQTSKLAAKEEEVARLRTLVAKYEASIEANSSAFASRETELASKNAAIAERDARIAALSEQLGAANAKIELAQTANEVKAVMVGDAPEPADEETTRALYMFNMLGGVMGAFQQQVTDARLVGEQEGRAAVQRELQETLEKARNDGYRDAMSYLDDRVTTARENGAREERARIANMSYFERRRYLRMHIA